MKITDYRINSIKPQDIVDGNLYHVTLQNRMGEKEEYIAMGVYSANIDVDIRDDEVILVDLTDGMLFSVKYDEFEKIELLNAEIVVK